MQLVDPEEEKIDFDANDIKDAFFELTTSLLKHYPKFFTPPKKKESEMVEFKDLFNVSKFLSENKSK